MWNKRKVSIESGLERVAYFIFNNHGEQDWENTIHKISDYLAAFIGARQKDVYEDLINRLRKKGGGK